MFVSYCRCDKQTRGVRDAIAAALKVHTVFVDDVIEPSDPWRAVINNELAGCRAAVVLIDRPALASRWVIKEVNILLWRFALGSDLTIVPVLLDGVARDEIHAAGIGDLLEQNFERINAANGLEEAVGRISEVIDRIPEMLSFGADPMSDWVERVAVELGSLSDDDLNLPACELDESKKWVSYKVRPERVRFLAHQLIDQGLDGRVHRAAARMRGRLIDERFRRFIGEVLPSWVDAGAAHRLLMAARAKPRPVVVLNARWLRTGRQYFDRATCRAVIGYRVAVAAAVPGDEPVRDLIGAMESGLRQMVHHPEDEPLEDLERPRETCFLIVDSGSAAMGTVGTAVALFRKRFDWVTLVLLAGRGQMNAHTVQGWLGETPFILLPELGNGDELKAHRLVEDLLGLLPASMRGDVA
ncbi:toll/interleukin-1 receptor domain-containing protein [Micromonospora sp. NBC_00362]|uniref:toll/interleukin-1 receptor domain-containing protein n=1 Tax=Micromonospora sp. NBC_00362 TaxID=2975975 RepID=UPI0022588AED|nr:toll/interleukin-1 receptor domain-containing protein [Micromonospora sp. NBC_00362]MCX5117262.1 toll/interleukin-1 receptor domain-containing protein [Micromonospora sp. NBC_00362]